MGLAPRRDEMYLTWEVKLNGNALVSCGVVREIPGGPEMAYIQATPVDLPSSPRRAQTEGAVWPQLVTYSSYF